MRKGERKAKRDKKTAVTKKQGGKCAKKKGETEKKGKRTRRRMHKGCQ